MMANSLFLGGMLSCIADTKDSVVQYRTAAERLCLRENNDQVMISTAQLSWQLWKLKFKLIENQNLINRKRFNYIPLTHVSSMQSCLQYYMYL